MKATEFLKEYSEQTETILDDLFTQLGEDASPIDPFVVEANQRLRQFLRGGKKHRGALCVLAYEVFGKGRGQEILKASLAIEITHAAMLIHDDFMDQDELRRNQPTIHRQFEQYHIEKIRRSSATDSPHHFGISQAVNLGDVAIYLAQEVLSEVKFSEPTKATAMNILANTIRKTAYGQVIDILYENKEDITVDDVLRVHSYKTANYSATLSLQIGATLAGVNSVVVDDLQKYGYPAGLAFQIRDDEIGLFQDQGTIGKPSGSDVRQNKNTILKIKALEKASPEDRKFLLKAYGNKDLTTKELERVREITKETGAYDFSHELGRGQVEKAREYVPQITTNPTHQSLLRDIADFMIEREK